MRESIEAQRAKCRNSATESQPAQNSYHTQPLKEINTNNNYSVTHIQRVLFSVRDAVQLTPKSSNHFFFSPQLFMELSIGIGRDLLRSRSSARTQTRSCDTRGCISSGPADVCISFLGFLIKMFSNSILLQEVCLHWSRPSHWFQGSAILQDKFYQLKKVKDEVLNAIHCDQVPYSIQKQDCIFYNIPFAASIPVEALPVALHIPQPYSALDGLRLS